MRLTAIIVLGLMGICLAEGDAPPVAPEGYAWQELAAVNGAVLKPEGWFFKEETSQGTRGFFISKEDFEKEGPFETGLTINCITQIPQSTGRSPSEYATGYADAAASQYEVLDRATEDQGDFKIVTFRNVDAPQDQISITIFTKLIANDKTGTLYLIIFEAPTKEWDMTWIIGDVMLKSLKLDPAK